MFVNLGRCGGSLVATGTGEVHGTRGKPGDARPTAATSQAEDSGMAAIAGRATCRAMSVCMRCTARG